MRNDITAGILHFFNTKRMLRSLNLSIITLIPEKRSLMRLEDYRPISSLGVTYKIFSKILATRLMTVPSGIINPNLTTFIKGRRITNAIGLAQEFTNPSIVKAHHAEHVLQLTPQRCSTPSGGTQLIA